MNNIIWEDILNKFLEFTVDELALPVIIGGDNYLEDFYGFETIGKKSDKPLTGIDVLNILGDLEPFKLKSLVSDKEHFNEKLGIGVSKVAIIHTIWGENDSTYEATQDYLVDDGYGVIPEMSEVNEIFEEQKRTYRACKYEPVLHEILNPGSVIVIETVDGACMLGNKDYLL